MMGPLSGVSGEAAPCPCERESGVGDCESRSDVEKRPGWTSGGGSLSSEYTLESEADAWRDMAMGGSCSAPGGCESDAERACACSVRWSEDTSSRAGIDSELGRSLSPLPARTCAATSDGITSALSPPPTPTIASLRCVDPRGERGDVRSDPLRPSPALVATLDGDDPGLAAACEDARPTVLGALMGAWDRVCFPQ